MSGIDDDAGHPADDRAPAHAPPAHHAGRSVRAIAALEAAKSIFALLAASGLEILGPAPIRRFLGWLIEVFRFDAHHSLVASVLKHVEPASVHAVAAGAAAYGALHLLEAWGLWRQRLWASWLGCLSASVYLPFELWALIREPGWVALAVVAINLAIVAVLARDVWRRQRPQPA